MEAVRRQVESRPCPDGCSERKHKSNHNGRKWREERVEEDEGDGDLGHVRVNDNAGGGGDILLLGDREADGDG